MLGRKTGKLQGKTSYKQRGGLSHNASVTERRGERLNLTVRK